MNWDYNSRLGYVTFRTKSNLVNFSGAEYWAQPNYWFGFHWVSFLDCAMFVSVRDGFITALCVLVLLFGPFS